MLLRGLATLSVALVLAPIGPAYAALADGPLGPHGDMGCVAATAYFAAAASKAAKDPTKDEDSRQRMATIRDLSQEDNRFYMGRVSLLPAEKRGRAQYDAAFDAFIALTPEERVTQVRACSDWGVKARAETSNSWFDKK